MVSTSKIYARYLGYRRRVWLLNRLRKADGVLYDELCRELIEVSPALGDYGNAYSIRTHSVRAIRSLLWNQLAVTESDESIWLTPLGWSDAEIDHATENAARWKDELSSREKSTVPSVSFNGAFVAT